MIFSTLLERPIDSKGNIKSETNTKNIIDNYYQIINFKKPLNSISSYNYKDLEKIANKLEIDVKKNNKLKLKKDLYNEILEYL